MWTCCSAGTKLQLYKKASWSALAAATKCYRLGGLNNNKILPTVMKSQKSKIRVLADSVSDETPFLACRTLPFCYVLTRVLTSYHNYHICHAPHMWSFFTTGIQWTHYLYNYIPGGSDGKESTCNAGDLGSISGVGRFPGEGHATHSSIFAWKISMNRGAWWAAVQTRLSTAQLH